MHNMLNSNSKTQSERAMQRERPLIHEASDGGWVSERDVIVIPSLPLSLYTHQTSKDSEG